MNAIDRFLHYVTFDTQSSETSGTHPSSAGQLVLARVLANELAARGARDVHLSETGYVYATIPASAGREGEPALGFLAHLDSGLAESGEKINSDRRCSHYRSAECRRLGPRPFITRRHA